MLNKFLTHFKNLSRLVDTKEWYDGMIQPGKNINKEVLEQLEVCDVIFLLISPDYISSYYCYEKELSRAIERHMCGDCIVVPVILRSFLQGNYLFSELKFVPTDGKPIDQFKTQNSGFVDAFTGIRNLLQEYQKQRAYDTEGNGQTGNFQLCPKELRQVVKYNIVENGEICKKVLEQKVFDCFENFSETMSSFSVDMNALTIECIEQFKSSASKAPRQLKHIHYRRELEGFLLGLSGYIQQHFLGNDNTCIHFRVEEDTVYKDYYDVGYRNIGLPIEPIVAKDGMIECAIKNHLPAIKSYNIAQHRKTHPKEKIDRNYITFVFEELSNKYNINLSMCMSIVNSSRADVEERLLTMSIMRFDFQIEKYLLQYIAWCIKIDNKYDVKTVFKPEV